MDGLLDQRRNEDILCGMADQEDIFGWWVDVVECWRERVCFLGEVCRISGQPKAAMR